MQIRYCVASELDELEQIIALQQQNLRCKKSMEEEDKEGFVTVQHDIDLLKKMNEVVPHVIAKDGNKVVGYALAMTRDFKNKIAVLTPMFDLMDNLEINGIKMGTHNYIVMGQVCVDVDYRGKGVFKGMYDLYFKEYKTRFGYIVTEVAARNKRSLRAHFKVGFEIIYQYEEPGFENWIVIRY